MKHYKIFKYLVLIFFVIALLKANAQNSDTNLNVGKGLIKSTLSSYKADTINSNDSIKYSLPIKNTSELKVVFVKGDNKSDDIFKYIFPIITLILGIGINQLLDFWKDYKNIKIAGEQWLVEMVGLIGPLKKQIENLEELSTKEQEEKSGFTPLKVIKILDGEIFKTLDKNDLAKYVESHKKLNYKQAVKISTEAFGCISILAELDKSLRDEFEKFKSESSNHYSSVNKSLQSLSKSLNSYEISLEKRLNSPASNDPGFKQISDLFDAHIEPHKEKGDFDLFKLETDFFLPLSVVLAHLKQEEGIQQFVNLTTDCLNSIKGVKMEKHYWRQNLLTFIKQYQEQVHDLEIIVGKIE